mgnify:FL=1
MGDLRPRVAALSLWEGVSTSNLDQTLIPFQGLVGDCWALLRGDLRAVFPTTTPAHPSRFVILQPSNAMWMGDLWEGVVVPTLTELLAHTPTYPNGWRNPMSRNLVEAYLRRNLTASRWLPLVNFSG